MVAIHANLFEKLRLLALLFSLVPASSFGATFYCDPAHGSPQGDGSAAHPWQTIEGVLAAKLIQLVDKYGKCANPNAPIKSGDTILLRSGWQGVLQINRGYNEQVITIAAEPSTCSSGLPRRN